MFGACKTLVANSGPKSLRFKEFFMFVLLVDAFTSLSFVNVVTIDGTLEITVE